MTAAAAELVDETPPPSGRLLIVARDAQTARKHARVVQLKSHEWRPVTRLVELAGLGPLDRVVIVKLGLARVLAEGAEHLAAAGGARVFRVDRP